MRAMDFTRFKVPSRDQVLADLRNELSGAPVEVDSEWEVALPDEELEIVAESLHRYEFDIGLGDHHRVLVAIGGVRDVDNGVPKARRFFATLWYSPEGRLISIDLTREAP